MPREASAPVEETVAPLPLSAAVAEARIELVRERLMEEMLLLAGEVGFRDTTVQEVLDRCGGHTIQFYKQFANKEECFAIAYETWIERVGSILLEAAAKEAPSWREGLRAALVELFRFVNEQPAISRALFLEVQIAGGPALDAREAAMERVAEAVDSARREIPAAEAPPEVTSMFVVGGIEACVCGALADGRPEHVWGALPELMHLAVGSYFGEEAAEEEEEFEAARAVAEREKRAAR
jgi:AcrR family transcriptional regulator